MSLVWKAWETVPEGELPGLAVRTSRHLEGDIGLTGHTVNGGLLCTYLRVCECVCARVHECAHTYVYLNFV